MCAAPNFSLQLMHISLQNMRRILRQNWTPFGCPFCLVDFVENLILVSITYIMSKSLEISLLWVLFGFSLAFGESINGWGLIGNPLQYAFLNNLDAKNSNIPFLLFDKNLISLYFHRLLLNFLNLRKFHYMPTNIKDSFLFL